MKRPLRRCAAGWWPLLLAIGFLAGNFARAGEVSPDAKLLWSSYMICWALNRDYHGFYDRPLERPPRDAANVRLVDLRRAIEAGVDALSVDLFITDKHALPAFGDLVKLVNEHQLPIQLSPMFDGLADPGLPLDDVAAKLQQWFERFAQEPCVARVRGRPVLFTFGANSLTPEQWQMLWRRLHAAHCDGYWIAELSHYLSVGETPDFVGARAWLDLFPTANAFNVHSPERSRDVIRGYASLYPTGHAWVAPVSIGYWRPEIAVYSSQRGTALFRDTWKTIHDSNVRWVQQSTWNDFSENHHIMPSENYGTVFVELNRWLTEQWKGQPPNTDRPRLYLSQQQEVLVGEDSEWELLAFVPPGRVPAVMQLNVRDAEGRRVHAFPDRAVNQPGLQVLEARLPIAALPPGRILLPEALLRDASGTTIARVQGPYTIVSAGGYRPDRNFTWLHTGAQGSASTLSCSLQISDADLNQPAATLHVESASDLADVELLHDGCQLLALRRDSPQTSLRRSFDWQGPLPVNRRGRLDWGTYTARAITVDGQMATSRPVFIDRPSAAGVTVGHWTFDADSAQDVLDSSPWLHDGRLGGRPRRKPWFPAYAPDPWGGKCLQFDGQDDRVLLEGAIVPPQAFTVECWIKPAANSAAAKSGQILFATANAAVVLSLDRAGHLQVTRKSADRWRGVADRSPVAWDEWQHVAATYDGTLLRLYRQGRLVGECSAPGPGKSGQVAIGYNSVTNQSFYQGALDELRLSARALLPAEFGPHNPLRETSLGKP